MKYSSKIRIINSSSEAKIFCLEPWAEEFEMLSKMAFEIVVQSNDKGEFEVDFDENQITVFVWINSIAKVLLDGKNICKAGHIQTPAFLL